MITLRNQILVSFVSTKENGWVAFLGQQTGNRGGKRGIAKVFLLIGYSGYIHTKVNIARKNLLEKKKKKKGKEDTETTN